MINGLVTIIIPAYNVQEYVGECIESTINQTYQNIEVLVIDDFSTDDTAKEICKYNNKGIKFIKNTENIGVALTRNRGLLNASGEYIFFLDADDTIKEETIEIMVDEAKKYNCDVVECLFYRDSMVDVDSSEVNIIEKEITKSFIIDNALRNTIWGKLYRTSLLKSNHITFPNVRYYEDIIFSHKVYGMSECVVKIQKQLYYYRVNPNSIMHSEFNHSKAEDMLVNLNSIYTLYKEANNKAIKTAITNTCLTFIVITYSKLLELNDNCRLKEKYFELFKYIKTHDAETYKQISLCYRLVYFAFEINRIITSKAASFLFNIRNRGFN